MLTLDTSAIVAAADSPTEQDIARIDQLTKRYASLPLGLADAAVVASAERNGGRVMTFDADFQVVAQAGTISVERMGR